jgi:NADH-quinone oxidoreductase subunit H
MMYLVGEYLHMVTAAFLIVILFLGGWHFWGLTGAGDLVTWPVAILRVLVLMVKVLAVIFFFMVARWSWPRFRYDQLMGLAWLVMLPLGMVNLVFVAVWREYGDRAAAAWGTSAMWLGIVGGWIVAGAAWLVATLLVPAASDNRPRHGPIMPSFETEEATP